MKKILLPLSLAFATGNVSAQCTPDPLYQDSVFGVWPDTIEDFLPGQVGAAYLDQLDLKIPVDAGDVDPNFAGNMIDSIIVTGVTGLPPGLSIDCNSQTGADCTYLSGVLGCAVIQGTPTSVGSYPLVINTMIHAVAFGFPIALPYPFPGYQIDVGPAGINDLPLTLSAAQNTPNPFSSRTTIEWSLSRPSLTKVKVFNLLGEKLWSQNVDGRTGQNKFVFDGSTLEDGIYLYEVQAGDRRFTGRMVLHR